MKDRPRKWRGFAALEREGGALIWGTLRATEAEARRTFERHNPMRPAVIVSIEMRTNGKSEPSPPSGGDA